MEKSKSPRGLENAQESNSSETFYEIFYKYYSGPEFVLTFSGILTLIFIVLCLVASLLFLAGGPCATANVWIIQFFPAVQLLSGVLVAILYLGTISRLGMFIPRAWLYFDIFICTSVIILLLVASGVTTSLCFNNRAFDVLPSAMGVIAAILLLVAMANTYLSSLMKWERGSRKLSNAAKFGTNPRKSTEL